MALVFLLYALFATIFPLGKLAMQFAGPFFTIGIRLTLAGAAILLYQFFVDRTRFVLPRMTTWGYLLVALIVSVYVTNGYEFWALQFVPAAKVAFIYNLTPLFSALLSYIFFHERMTAKKWLGFALALVGMLPLFASESPGEVSLGHVGFFSFAELALILCVFATAYSWIVVRRLLLNYNYPVAMANGVSMFVGGLLSLAHSAIAESWTPSPVTNWLPFIQLTLVMALIANVICYNLYAHLLKTYTATLVSLVGFTAPLFTVLFSWMLLGERVSWPFVVSTIIVLVGLYLFYQEELRQGYVLRGRS